MEKVSLFLKKMHMKWWSHLLAIAETWGLVGVPPEDGRVKAEMGPWRNC